MKICTQELMIQERMKRSSTTSSTVTVFMKLALDMYHGALIDYSHLNQNQSH